MRLRAVVDDLTSPEIAALLGEHLASMHEQSPPGSVHALDLERLRDPAVTFWSAWFGADLAGCGALRELSPTEGEVKSMRTADAFRRRGVAGRLLTTILDAARERGYQRVSLETGSGPAFAAAHALYAAYGFEACGPFGDYPADPPDPFSRFYTLGLLQTPR